MSAAADIKLPGWKDEQVDKAVASLLKFIGKQQASSKDLFGEDEEVLYLQLALRAMPQQARKDKPVPLPLPHPIWSSEGAEICLFVKDVEGEGHKDAKRRLAKLEKNGGVAKVVGLSKLRTKYESHEAKRQLCRSYDLFLADKRVLPSLPKLIGKSFFKRKKQPIPVDLTAKDWAAQVARACQCTYLFPATGTSINVKVGRSGQAPAELAANVRAALVGAVAHVPKQWANVQGVFLKTAESAALPLYQALPDEPHKI